MTATEKQTIYNLLKTAAGGITGFIPKEFSAAPVFTDDVQTAAAQSENAANLSENAANLSENAANLSENAANLSENAAKACDPSFSAGSLQAAAESSEAAGTESGNRPSVQSISEKIARCTRCDLARTRNNVVPGMGVENPLVLVVGEGPGYEEDMQGKPFVGKAGILLDKMLGAINLSRSTNCFIANVVKCRPPQNRDPLPEERSACSAFLEAQIKVLKPKLILCMGRIAGHHLLNNEESVSRLHGKFFEYSGIPLMVTYHPSALLREPSLKRDAWEDLKKFKSKIDSMTTTADE